MVDFKVISRSRKNMKKCHASCSCLTSWFMCSAADRSVWDECEGGSGFLRPPPAGWDGSGETIQRSYGPSHRHRGPNPHQRGVPENPPTAQWQEGWGGEGTDDLQWFVLDQKNLRTDLNLLYIVHEVVQELQIEQVLDTCERKETGLYSGDRTQSSSRRFYISGGMPC